MILRTKVTEPQHHEGFVYIRTLTFDDGSEKHYGGYKKNERFGGTYRGSPETEQIAEDLKTAINDVFEAVYFGSAENIVYKEISMLNAVNAAKSDNWYNQTNGGAKGLKNWQPHYEMVKFKIEHAGTELGYPRVQMHKKDVYELEAPQVRDEEMDLQHVKDTREKYRDDPLSIQEERGILIGGNLRLGWRHTMEGIMPLRDIVDIPSVTIPDKDWNKLTPVQKKGLGHWDNPYVYGPKREKPEEVGKYIAEVCLEQDIDPDHLSIDAEIESMNYTSYDKGQIKKHAREFLLNWGLEEEWGGTVKTWTTKELKELVENGPNKKNTVYSYISGGRLGKVIEQLVKSWTNPSIKQKKHVVYVHLSEARFKQSWDGYVNDKNEFVEGNKAKYERILNKLLTMMRPEVRPSFEFVEKYELIEQNFDGEEAA